MRRGELDPFSVEVMDEIRISIRDQLMQRILERFPVEGGMAKA